MLCSLQVPVQEARLKMMNKSKRYLTVKVMKGTERESSLHAEATLDPKSDYVFTFSETGKYFVKSMAVSVSEDGKSNDTLYTSGKPFKVIADPRKGYSQIKMKFKVKESKRPVSDGMKSITRGEFMKN
jgi:hypothetical protein